MSDSAHHLTAIAMWILIGDLVFCGLVVLMAAVRGMLREEQL